MAENGNRPQSRLRKRDTAGNVPVLTIGELIRDAASRHEATQVAAHPQSPPQVVPNLIQRRPKLPPVRAITPPSEGTREEKATAMLEHFKVYLTSRGRAQTTINQYLLYTGKYLLGTDTPFERSSVDAYLAGLRVNNLVGNSRRYHYYWIKTLFKSFGQPWVFENNEVPKKSRKFASYPRPKHSTSEMRAMEEAARLKGKKEHAIIRLSNSIGLRRVEIPSLNIEDFKPPYIRLYIAKVQEGGKEVWRKLDPGTCEVIQAWIDELTKVKKRADMEALFIRGKRGPRMTPGGLSNLQARIRKAAGIEKRRSGFHATRRGVVTMMHDGGMKNSAITKVFGWEDPNTVDNYIIEDPGEVEAQMEAVLPYWRKEKTFDKAEAVKDEMDSTGDQSMKPE